jgi:hypothetical protein
MRLETEKSGEFWIVRFPDGKSVGVRVSDASSVLEARHIAIREHGLRRSPGKLAEAGTAYDPGAAFHRAPTPRAEHVQTRVRDHLVLMPGDAPTSGDVGRALGPPPIPAGLRPATVGTGVRLRSVRPPLPTILGATARGALAESFRVVFALLVLAALIALTTAVSVWLAFPNGPTVQPQRW